MDVKAGKSELQNTKKGQSSEEQQRTAADFRL